MPPIPVPGARAVAFDDAAARHAIARFEALADRLDALVRAEHDQVAGASVHWAGPSRAWFDGAHADLDHQLRWAATVVRAAADQVRRNIAVAAARQADLNGQAERAAAADLARLAGLAGPPTP